MEYGKQEELFRLVYTFTHLFTLFAATFTQNVVRYMQPNWLFNIRRTVVLLVKKQHFEAINVSIYDAKRHIETLQLGVRSR